MRLLGIGIDLIDLAHFGQHYSDFDSDLLSRCFTEREILDAGIGIDRLAKLAARFAAKEAVFKAVKGLEGAAFTDIEVQSDLGGVPQICLYGSAKNLAAAQGVREIQVTLTHSPTSAAAFAVAVGGE